MSLVTRPATSSAQPASFAGRDIPNCVQRAVSSMILLKGKPK